VANGPNIFHMLLVLAKWLARKNVSEIVRHKTLTQLDLWVGCSVYTDLFAEYGTS